ncbi:MAG: MFS transporter, partial [Candidatus Levyibacteriota bacterium]
MNNRLLQALNVRPFLFLWLSEVFSQVAMNMLNFILLIVVFSLTNSNTAVSGIVLSFTVPAIIFGILAGVYVDRWNKKFVLLATNGIRAVLLLLLAFFHNNLFAVYTFSALVSVATQFFIPAESPMIPLLVKKETLLSANALFGMAIYGSILVAYALSGPFILFLGSTNAFLSLACLFIIAAIFVVLIQPQQVESIVKKKSQFSASIIEEIKQTFSLILRTKEIT